MFIALDLATTAGIAWVEPKSKIYYVTEVKGTAEKQFLYTEKLFSDKHNIVLIETFVYFARSAKTQSSIIKRIGVMEYLLAKAGADVELLNLNSVRAKYFKGKDKKKQCLEYFGEHHDINLTDNHTDALLMLFYYMNVLLDDEFSIRIV